MTRRVPWLVVLLAALIWAVPVQLGWYGDLVAVDVSGARGITDIPSYRDAGQAIVDGRVPYRDFSLEYPPLAAALFALAAVVPGSYEATFSMLMFACLVATALAALAIARALDFGVWRQALAGGAVAISPLFLGTLVQTRFDLLLAALLAWMVWAMIVGRWRLAWTLFAAATLTKLVPLLLAPLLVIFQRHRTDGARAIAGLAGGLAAVAAVIAPFAIMSPSGTWDLFEYHLDRPLQIESVGAAYMMVLDALADIGLHVETAFGSQGLIGDGPDAIAAISSAVLAVLVAAIAVTAARGLRRARPPGDARLFVAAAAATVAATLAGGKVLSPQFLIWLLPLGFLVAGRYGPAAFGVTAAALAVTGAYFPQRYWDLVDLQALPIALLVLRDALVVGLVAACWPRPHLALGEEGPALALRPARRVGQAARAVAARYLTD